MDNDSDLMKFANRELDRLVEFNKDSRAENEALGRCVLRLMSEFCLQNHSNWSAHRVMDLFSRLADWKPLTPLTGEDDEWNEDHKDFSGGVYQQNRRYSALFRYNHDNNDVKDINAVIYSDDGGLNWFHSSVLDDRFAEKITFPYYPSTEPRKVYIQWLDSSCTDFIDITGAEKHIKALRERYLPR